MGLNDDQLDRLAEFLFFLVLNLIVFFVSKIFVSVSIAVCVFGSLFNALWMTFLLLPVLRRIPGVKDHF